MHFSANSSIYSTERNNALDTYADFVYACSDSVKNGQGAAGEYECDFSFGVVSNNPLGSAALNALVASAEKLGYSKFACFFIALHAENKRLTDQELFTLLESIDPHALVISDNAASQAAAEAYKPAVSAPLQTDAFQRILGRDAVVFRSFEELLETPQKKQRAWALLKELKQD